MPVSGLVISLSEEPDLQAEALAAIGYRSEITMGVLEANQLAVVLDTPSSHQDKLLWQWLNSLPGVSLVEVAFVGFETPAEGGGEATGDSDNQERFNSPRRCTQDSKDKPHDGC